MRRVDFTYQLIEPNILFIIDQNMGGMSVTNGIEEVLEELAPVLPQPLDSYRIVYRDSYGIIDGISTKGGQFSGFIHIGATDINQIKNKANEQP